MEKNKAGDLVQTTRALSTGPEIKSLIIPKFHESMAKLGVEAIIKYNKDQRYFSSVSMSVSKNAYEQLIERIREFRKEVAETVAADENPDRAYQLNLQLFPLSKPKTKVGRKKRQ